MANSWRTCNFCKNSILLGQTYWKCSVSTCNRKGTSYVFCSVACWDGHVPVYNHRNAWAVEAKAPTTAEPTESKEREPAQTPKTAPPPTSTGDDKEILVVASKLKAYIREHSGLNTSASALDALSEHIRKICDDGIRRAEQAGRKTVLDRDIP